MFRSSLSFSLTLIMLVGCGDGRAKLGQVEGTVTIKDQPLKSGSIGFHPEKGRSGAGRIVDGKIVDVTTYDPNDGAPTGKLKVTVAVPTGGIETKADVKPAISLKYTDPNKSGLTATVEPGKKNVVEIKLTE